MLLVFYQGLNYDLVMFYLGDGRVGEMGYRRRTDNELPTDVLGTWSDTRSLWRESTDIQSNKQLFLVTSFEDDRWELVWASSA